MTIKDILGMSQEDVMIYDTVLRGKPKVLNPEKKTCFLCKRKIYSFTKPRGVRKHHISYYPEVTCYVHEDCHDKIHDPDNPINRLIMYTRSEAIRFYRKHPRVET